MRKNSSNEKLMKFLERCEQQRLSFKRDTKQCTEKIGQFRSSVHNLEELIDFKLVNPYERGNK